MITLRGIAASPGIAIGQVNRLQEEKTAFLQTVGPDKVPEEKARFFAAQRQAAADLAIVQEHAAASFGVEQAEVFAAHKLMLEAPVLVERVITAIEKKYASAEAAVAEATTTIACEFAVLTDEYMRERAADIKDIGKRLLRVLQGTVSDVKYAGVVVAQDLLPSDTVALDLTIVSAFITALGGKTSHSSILARASGIPAIVGLGRECEKLHDGDTVIVDGDQGLVLVNPGAGELEQYSRRLQQEQAKTAALAAAANLASVTADGWRVEVAANIGTPDDMAKVMAAGAEGVGLFRTEFLFLNKIAVPTEDEQVTAYRAALRAMPDKKVIIRTLDAGGDKQLPFLSSLPEANPALGLRAIRLCMVYRDVFKTQLRAMLRAGTEGQLHIMFPMIATLEELEQAKALLHEAANELAREGVAHRADVPVGIMVEIPAAAAIADMLAVEVDFFSIGTNDLVQYTMAVDRMNENVAWLNDYFQPSVLRLIATIACAAQKSGKWVGMCGEMAGDTLATPLLLGLGLTELSMNVRAVPKVKNYLRQLDSMLAKKWADDILSLRNAAEVKKYLEEIAAGYVL